MFNNPNLSNGNLPRSSSKEGANRIKYMDVCLGKMNSFPTSNKIAQSFHHTTLSQRVNAGNIFLKENANSGPKSHTKIKAFFPQEAKTNAQQSHRRAPSPEVGKWFRIRLKGENPSQKMDAFPTPSPPNHSKAQQPLPVPLSTPLSQNRGKRRSQLHEVCRRKLQIPSQKAII